MWDADTGAVLPEATAWAVSADDPRISPDGTRFAWIDGSAVRLIATHRDPEERTRRLRATAPDPAWHTEEAVLAEQVGDWFAAAFHLSRQLEFAPADRALLDRRAAVLAQGVASEPKDRFARAAHARTRLDVGDLPGYREACAALAANRVAWPRPHATCWLAAGAVRNLKPLVADAHREALRGGRPGDLRDLGGLLLRSNRPAAAVVWLRLAVWLRRGVVETVHEELLLALAYQKLGQPAEADRWLARATVWMDRHRLASQVGRVVALAGGPAVAAGLAAVGPRSEGPDPRAIALGWQTWLELEILRREGEAARKPRQPRGKPASVPLTPPAGPGTDTLPRNGSRRP